MFYGTLNEKGDVKLVNTTVDAFVGSMRSFYKNEIKIEGSETKLTELLALAHMYDVNWLETSCIHILKQIIDQNASAVVWVLPLANLYDFHSLRQKCMDTIVAHGANIIKSTEFIDCEDIDVLKALKFRL